MTVDEFAVNDVAYALGALSATERLAFEAHLYTCDSCTARVGQAFAATALLTAAHQSAFDDNVQGAAQINPGANDPGSSLPRQAATPRSLGRRHRVVGAVTGLAAAIAATVVLLVAQTGGNADPFRAPAQALPMAAASGQPISVRMQIQTKDTWAQVNLWCSYPVSGFAAGDYTAVARTRSGRTVLLGSWPSVPGNTAIIRTPTGLHTSDIATVEVRNPSGQALSWTTF